jgi:hypothetical protein
MRNSSGFSCSLAARLVAFALASSVAAQSFAHHSFAMFDRESEVVLKGTVKDLQWTNPHVFIQLIVVDPAGKEEEWSIESASPNMLFRQGWTPKVLLPGDKITVTINPLRSGGRGGYFLTAQLPDGRILGQRSRPPG